MHITTTTSPNPTMAITVPSADRERVGYLFGHPIAHSMSPLLHQTVYDGIGLNWSQLPLDSTDMLDFLERIKDPRFYGTIHAQKRREELHR